MISTGDTASGSNSKKNLEDLPPKVAQKRGGMVQVLAGRTKKKHTTSPFQEIISVDDDIVIVTKEEQDAIDGIDLSGADDVEVH
jgi:hypothetical protein